MKKTTLTTLILIAASFGAHAQDATTSATPAPAPADAASGGAAANGGWTGTGELGFASARGNSRSENLNAKLGLSQENDYWKNNFFLNGLRSKGDATITDSDGAQVTKYTTTANRYDTGASVGYKLDPRSYIVTATRYEHDDFGANRWQAIVSVGYGYIALKNESAELSFEVGPGYKEYRPAPTTTLVGTVNVTSQQDTQNQVVGRGLINGKYRLTDNTSLEDTLLIEAGAQNKYYQNDTGVSVSMTKKMALKLGYQIRYNSDTLPGIRSTDELLTTNLVYNF
jgi:putative salt-induced outer membrane protein